VIFKIPASSYWWVRYYADSHIFKRTTKTENKRDALEAAKRFYDDINLRMHGVTVFEGLPIDTNAAEVIPFRKVTHLLMEFEKPKLSESSWQNSLTKTSSCEWTSTSCPSSGTWTF
jgi:hypothetical protein